MFREAPWALAWAVIGLILARPLSRSPSTTGQCLRRECAGADRLSPMAAGALSAEVLLQRWNRLPPLDPQRLQADFDATLNARVLARRRRPSAGFSTPLR